MSGKQGMRDGHPRPTPRRGMLSPTDDVADPARGEKVPRCFACGLPASEGNPILPGLWGYVHRNVLCDLCERCVLGLERRMDARLRMEADPLTVWEDVA